MRYLIGAAILLMLQVVYLGLRRALAARRNRLPYQSDFHARRGAAYSVIFALLEENPDAVADSAGYDRVLAKIQAVRRWASTRDKPTKRAYMISARDILNRAHASYVNNQRARQMHLMRRIMPTPPSDLLTSHAGCPMSPVQQPGNVADEKLASDDHPTIQ